MTTTYRRRSLFWPLVLIGVGLIWLLGNLGIISGASIAVLFRLWPLILIIVGLDLLVGRGSSGLSTLIGVGGVALIIALMLVGPSLGWAGDTEMKTANLSAPVGDAASAHVNLGLSVGDASVKALSDSTQLITADVNYIGSPVTLDVQGNTDKTVRLSQEPGGDYNFGFNIFNWQPQKLRWDIALTPNIPLDLNISGGVGSGKLDFSGLKLTNLQATTGVGDIEFVLPDGAYSVNITGGVGKVTLVLPGKSGVRIDASTGVGSINMASNLTRVGGNETKSVGEEGVWQTASYDNADQKISIRYHGGVGELTVR
jgi:predicted membrane protein